jgi:hypothetical protein
MWHGLGNSLDIHPYVIQENVEEIEIVGEDYCDDQIMKINNLKEIGASREFPRIIA